MREGGKQDQELEKIKGVEGSEFLPFSSTLLNTYVSGVVIISDIVIGYRKISDF